MIICNLKVKLAENRLKISKVYNDTGISRSTLTSLSENQSKGIQFDTLNTLCNYLKISPGDLFIYSPIDIDINLAILTVTQASGAQLDPFTEIAFVETAKFNGVTYLNVKSFRDKYSIECQIKGSLSNEKIVVTATVMDNSVEETKSFKRDYEHLPRELKVHIIDMINSSIMDELKGKQFYWKEDESAYIPSVPINTDLIF